jgi:uncharacterized NAD(P)/FAD-binding protein YdhS
MDESNKRRFLRHARARWDVVRHRAAPEAAERIAHAITRGQLRIRAGTFVSSAKKEGRRVVHIRPRGETNIVGLFADHLIDCTGLLYDIRFTKDPLVLAMLKEGLARTDTLGIGLDFGENFALLDATGSPSRSIFGVGPVTKSLLWEIIAIPDIRNQTAELARYLNKHLVAK